MRGSDEHLYCKIQFCGYTVGNTFLRHTWHYEQPGDVVCDGSGNVYVSGKSFVNNGPDFIFLRKYNTSGALIFSTTFNTPQNYSEYAICMGLDAAGNVYLGGHVVKAEAILL